MSVELDPGLAHMVVDLQALGHRITSTVRTPEDNERVGGSPRSLHLTGRAFDVVPGDGWLDLVGDVIFAARRHKVPARILCETDHLHVDLHPVPGLSVEVPKRSRGNRYARIYES